MTIPLVDLGWQHDQIAEEVDAGFTSVFERTAFILGSEVNDFETAYAEFSGVDHCVGVGSGTDAIELALRALDLPRDSEVIVPANTFIATALAVVRAGLRPRIVDVEPDTYLMGAHTVAEALDGSVSAILPVHLFGQTAAVEEIAEIASDIPVVEDAAQSQGASRHGRRSGSLGTVGATSFYPGKNLGAYGDAGAITTDDPVVAERVRHLRNWGSDRKYHHPELGFNSRLDTLQAVVLLAKLRRLDTWNAMRSVAADRYKELLRGEPRVGLPQVAPSNHHVWHLFVVRVANRDRIVQELNEQGIGAGIHYPVPLHLHGALEDLGYGDGDFPVAERLANEIMSLPMFPGITASQQERVASALIDAASHP